MTLTINYKKYGQLLTQYQPKIITDKSENDRALNIAEALLNKQNLTPEEEEPLDLLVVLIENFESKKYMGENESTPLSRLLLLVEANNLRQADLLTVFGSLGDKANSTRWCEFCLRIVEIPDDIREWHIVENKGIEYILEGKAFELTETKSEGKYILQLDGKTLTSRRYWQSEEKDYGYYSYE